MGDRRGVAAVEMAFVAPLMIAAYFGVAEVTMSMMAHRHASHAAAAVGDLVTQSETINSATMTDIFKIATTMMRPFPEAPLKLRVTSVKMDVSNKIKVVWSQGSGGMSPLSAGATVVDPRLQTLLKPYESMVMTEMTYTFDSPLKQALPDALHFADTTYMKPRKSDEVLWSAG